jgi:hypothetical protein
MLVILNASELMGSQILVILNVSELMISYRYW